jgi:hypothetical protein
MRSSHLNYLSFSLSEELAGFINIVAPESKKNLAGVLMLEPRLTLKISTVPDSPITLTLR